MNKKVYWLSIVAVFVIVLVGCGQETLHYEQQKMNETRAKNVVDVTPTPIMERSLERENLARRAKFINQANRVGYLYLLTANGQLIREEQVQGKVSSLNSYLTPMQEIRLNGTVVEAPDIDGTWGENSGGIFWFTVDGTYREWSGQYLFSSERLEFESKPILYEVGR